MSSTDEPLVELRAADLGYGRTAVLRGVELSVRRGEFLGILGPNGSGKTTLFRGLLGLVEPLAGEVVRRWRSAGYVPQREHLDPLYPVTVGEVVEMGAYARLSGLRRLAREERALVASSLARVGLAEAGERPFAELSGGQRQRALIARALVARPEILMLDEPTSGVDAPAAAEILGLLARLVAEERLAVLLVSHQIGLVRERVEEVLWVAGGRVRRGPALEILNPERLERLFQGEVEAAAWS